MKYTKQALRISDQIEKLKNRGLTINDEENAKNVLSTISYYRLRAYTYPFQDNNNSEHPFLRKIDFNAIISLYRFDQKLRILVFDAMEKIEVALRTQIVYQYAMTYGSHWHMKRELYNTNKNYRGEYYFDLHINTIKNEIERSSEKFIEHYKENYDTPPMPPSWMSLEVVSMGTLSKIYKSLKISDAKKEISRKFDLPNPYILENWMLSFSHLRNICAHHSRLWNRRLTTNIKLPNNAKNTFYTKTEIKQILPYKIFPVLLAINYMLKAIDSKSHFGADLKTLMSSCPLEQESAMGFIKKWQENPFWE